MFSFDILGLILVLITNQLSICFSLDFCSDNSRNHLIDSLFAFNDTIYAFRSPNVFILTIDETGNWTQVEDAIPLNNLFKGYSRSSFDSGFSVTNFVKCDSQIDNSCPYDSPDFDATNITFLFFRREFHIFRRTDRSLFEAIDLSDENTVPWKAHQLGSTSLTELFDDTFQRVDGAIFTHSEDKTSPLRIVQILSFPSSFEYQLTDNPVIVRMRVRVNRGNKNSNSIGAGNGGFVDTRGDTILFFDNNVYKYVTENLLFFFKLEDLGTTWDYFNCESMGSFTVPTDPTSTQSTTTAITDETQSGDMSSKGMSSEEMSSEEMSSEEISSEETDPTEAEDSTDVSIEKSTEHSIDTDYITSEGFWGTDETKVKRLSPTEVNRWMSSTKDTPKDHNLTYEDEEYLLNLRTVLLITLSLLSITMICMTVLSFMCFTILS